MLIRPDGTDRKVVKRFRRSSFFFSAETSFVWGGPVWCPDGQQILFTASASEPYVDVMLLDLPTGRTTTKLKKALPIYGWVASHSPVHNNGGSRSRSGPAASCWEGYEPSC